MSFPLRRAQLGFPQLASAVTRLPTTNGPLLWIWACHAGGAQLQRPQGPGVRAGSRCCQLRGKRNGRGSQRDNFMPRDVGHLIAESPIARKRRVNRQETHQHQTELLSAGHIHSVGGVCLYSRRIHRTLLTVLASAVAFMLALILHRNLLNLSSWWNLLFWLTWLNLDTGEGIDWQAR